MNGILIIVSLFLPIKVVNINKKRQNSFLYKLAGILKYFQLILVFEIQSSISVVFLNPKANFVKKSQLIPIFETI